MIILAEYIILKKVIKISVLRFILLSKEDNKNLILIIKIFAISSILSISS